MVKTRLDFGFKQMIYYLYGDTLLPEIFEEIGEENTLKLISVFGGIKFAIPSYSKIRELKRNIDIYETLCHAHCNESIRILADKYEVTPVWIRAIFKKMRREYPRIIKFIETVEEPSEVAISTKRSVCKT